MRFTVIGHSTLFIEAQGVSLLVDPWLSGSAGWRSWWHFPPSVPVEPAWLAPRFVYLTHHHPDHFHYPSMRRLDRRTQVLIPRFGVDVMRGELERLGFADVRELPHGEILELVPGLRVASYQYGFDDTLFAVSDGRDVIVDVNDCKIRGLAMRQVRRDFGRPSVMLKSHSFAQAYPVCYEAEAPEDLELVARSSYTDDFAAAIRELEPRSAVPFGSMVAFLHPESRHVNRHIITPGEVARACAQAPGCAGTEVVPLAPGDRWSGEGGFERSGFDWYVERERHLDALAAGIADKLAENAAQEAARALPFERFAGYFERFMRAVPWPARRVFLGRPIVFEFPAEAEPYWVLDFRQRRVQRLREPPPEAASRLRVAPGMLADAIDKGVVHFVHGTMRLRVWLRPGGSHGDLAFWGFLMIWEIGYLPLRRVARTRFLAVLWRRRREAFDSLRALLQRGSPFARLSARFATPGGPAR